jgi:hypothetical protein
VEQYQVNGVEVDVKREDLCTSNHPYAPPFSKVRGLAQKLKKIADQGFEKVGYVETSVSMAGWGVAFLAPSYGLHPVIFDPQYVITEKRLKRELHLKVLQYHREMWRMFGAEIIPVKAGRFRITYNVTRKQFSGDSKMTFLPLGLPLSDTREETTHIAKEESQRKHYSTVVVNVGSGTICSGVVKGFHSSRAKVIGVMGRTGSVERKRADILRKVGLFEGGLLDYGRFQLVDCGYQYTQSAPGSAPFPCHPFYDLKAWKWLEDNIEELEPPILFWNIGSAPYREGEGDGGSFRQGHCPQVGDSG